MKPKSYNKNKQKLKIDLMKEKKLLPKKINLLRKLKELFNNLQNLLHYCKYYIFNHYSSILLILKLIDKIHKHLMKKYMLNIMLQEVPLLC